MKQNLRSIVAGVILLLFAALLFLFQVRQTEVAVVTTFGKPTRPITEPGLYGKWPWPIQTVHRLDRRTHNFEGKFEETLTADGYNLLIMVYIGWEITDPATFFPKFEGGSAAKAEESLAALVRTAKNETVGRHPFTHFISTDAAQLKFAEIEQEMLAKVQASVSGNNYGIGVKFLGIKKLGLPESTTAEVFKLMESERQVLISKIQFEGEQRAREIRSAAESEAATIVANADAQATRIRGEGEAAAAKSFAVFQQNPELANFLLRLGALESTLREKATLILDQNTPPLDLLKAQPAK